MNDIEIEKLINDMEYELRNNILPFWIEHSTDDESSAFCSNMPNGLTADSKHDNTPVLNSRILWTYSRAYSYYNDEKYRVTAERAYYNIIKYFTCEKYSGVYSIPDNKGISTDTGKQIGSIALAICSLSEFYRATGRKESLDYAISLYKVLEYNTYDTERAVNIHLYVLEAYTNLYSVWKDKSLKQSLNELIRVIIDYIIDPLTFQFRLSFDKNWTPFSKAVSYGYDIEGSWLLYEAAKVLGNEALLVKVRIISVLMVKRIFADGVDRKNGGLFYGKKNGLIEDIKEGWLQAEGVVGFINAYQLTGEACYLNEAYNIWRFIEKHIIDRVTGEWFPATIANGSQIIGSGVTELRKYPYCNSRMCFEAIDRLKQTIYSRYSTISGG